LLPKKERLFKERDIKAVIKSRQFKAGGALLNLVACENKLQLPRLAIVTPRKLGNAVKRNRVRRRLFEIFAEIKPNIARNVDMVVFPSLGAVDNSYWAIKDDVVECLKECSLY